MREGACIPTPLSVGATPRGALAESTKFALQSRGMRIKKSPRAEVQWGRLAIVVAFLVAFCVAVLWPSSQPSPAVRVQESRKVQVDSMGPLVAKWAELTDLGRKTPRGSLIGEEGDGGDEEEEGEEEEEGGIADEVGGGHTRGGAEEVEEGGASAGAWGAAPESGISNSGGGGGSIRSSPSSSEASRSSGSSSKGSSGSSGEGSSAPSSDKGAGGDGAEGTGEPKATGAGDVMQSTGDKESLKEASGKQEQVLQPAQPSNGTSDGSDDSDRPRCPPLSKELLQKHAKNNTVMLGVMNKEQQDFGRNWLHYVRALNLSYYVVGATDANTSVLLTELKVPCFDFSQESKSLLKLDPTHAFDWGAEGWRRMTWHKVFMLDKVVDWGFNVVMSDMDVTWLRDPLPLFAKHPHAEIIFSADGVGTANQPGDEGLDVQKQMWENFNTGVYLLRPTPNTSDWVHAWRALFDSGFGDHDQHGAYNITRFGHVTERPLDPRVHSAYGEKLWLGVMPPTLFSNTHSYYVQRLHQRKGVKPYEVHYTWSYNGRGGKLFRVRDAMLWRDPPSYYSEGNFVTVDLRLPKTPEGYNIWTENEQMITYHLSQLQAQLFQAYVGMALAVASGRAFISPKFQCYCDKVWYAVIKCRMLDAPDLQFPFTCPTDYIFKPDQFRDCTEDPSQCGTPIDFRENSFLDNPLTPAAVKNSVLVIQPSESLTCSDCVEFKEADGKKVLQVPANLKDRQLLPLLKPYAKYRVWKLSYDGVQLPMRAFGGFACAGTARVFDTRMARITGDWCCRSEEEAKGYGKEEEIVVPYRMGRVYSQQKDLDDRC